MRHDIGGPPTIQVRVQRDLLVAIEDYRRNEPDIPTRPEAVRRLIQRALVEPHDDSRQSERHPPQTEHGQLKGAGV
jgi:hypothetical protein